MMRFHLDEHVAHAVAEALAHRGYDVTTAATAGLLSAPDEAHLEFARKEGRVIFANDADFLRIARQDQAHSGIVYAQPASRSIGEIVRFVTLLDSCLEAHEMVGVIEFA